MLIERIFFTGHLHPGKDNGASSGNDIGKTLVFLETSGGSFIDPYMDGHKVHSVFGMHLYNINPFFGSDFLQGFVIVDNGIVDRNGSDDCRALGSEFSPEFLGITEGTKVHNGFCPHFYCVIYFFKFHIQVFPVSGSTKIYIDFCFQHRADSIRLQAGMELVGRNHGLSLGHQRLKLSDIYLFLFCHCLHLRGDDSLAGSVHLCCIAHRFPPIKYCRRISEGCE